MSSTTTVTPRPPTPGDFGQGFNYDVWSPNSTVSLCAVPWDSNYRDVVFFENGIVEDYLPDNTVRSYNNSQYMRCNQPVVLPFPFEVVAACNYVVVQNPAQPLPPPLQPTSPTTFCYFIIDVQYLAPGSTKAILQLDIWQTWNKFVSFGNVYIEQGHIGIANENQYDNQGRTFLTVPESHELGGDYLMGPHWTQEVIPSIVNDTTDPTILVGLTVDITQPFGTEAAPAIVPSGMSGAEGLPTGVSYYIFTGDAFKTFITDLQNFPWIAQCITTISPATFKDGDDPPLGAYGGTSTAAAEIMAGCWEYVFGTSVGSSTSWTFTGVLSYIAGKLPARYSNLKKFLVSPYMKLEMTFFTGNPVLLDPEKLEADDVLFTAYVHQTPPNPSIVVIPQNYAVGLGGGPAPGQSTPEMGDNGEGMNVALIASNFPSFTTIVNSGELYNALNASRIAFSYQSANWSQQKALRSAQTAYDQGLVGMGASALGGALAGGLEGGGIGAVAGAAIGIGEQAYQTQTNYNLAKYAAKGDYGNTIAGIQAQIKDMQHVPPSTVGQSGGDPIIYQHQGYMFVLRARWLQPGPMRTIGEYWLRYGYQVNEFYEMPSNYQVMTNFTYWKLQESYLSQATIHESWKQALRAIFEKGVTVWNDPSKIGVIDRGDNAPLSGITLPSYGVS